MIASILVSTIVLPASVSAYVAGEVWGLVLMPSIVTGYSLYFVMKRLTPKLTHFLTITVLIIIVYFLIVFFLAPMLSSERNDLEFSDFSVVPLTVFVLIVMYCRRKYWNLV